MTLTELFKKTIYAKYIQLEEQTASYLAEEDGDTLYIYFQGSNGETDWCNNFDFPAKPYRDMKNLWFAHRGFLRVWKVIEPYLAPLVCNQKFKHIIISGYSHGGALALLCHEYCKFNRPEAEVESYGFDAPRVVWGFFGKTVKRRFEGFTIIRNCCDIVTHLPPILFGFTHVGKMIHIGKNKKYNPIESHNGLNILKELEEYEKCQEN